MALTGVLKSIIDWLRAGYPEGVPEGDYLPLFALLGSHLSDDEINTIADELTTSSDPATGQAIRDALGKASDRNPLNVDVARVRARLAEGGWPLAMPHGHAGHAGHAETVSD
ncbi:MAG TPA: DUF3349 domain-containing protein [Streptosporangiaceae bacterium]|jgi:hypothetical protein|nr:DUF3349 domain-containing protein [Streptosporangiaceae bacterium]